ncbi:terminase small subunit [Viridibacillus sp. NPDC096237]|uniref:terminase small subunit n=1 Tax=Viridibacillus sp. NPDC096237 TaxID=3390721 RepID=UPI003D07B295
MARPRDPNRDKAFEMWKEHNGDITNRKLGELLDVPEKTISAWKSRDKWNKQMECSTANDECSTTNKKQPKKNVKKEPVESELVVSDDNELTDKQRLFVAFYVKSWNATKAYKKAYECGYNTAMVEGSRHLRNPKINAEIIRVRDEITGDALLSKRVLLQKWIDIAFADMTDFVEFGSSERVETDYDGKPMLDENGEKITYTISQVSLVDSSEVDGTLITEVKKGKDGISIKLADKMKALDFLTKHMDLLDDRELKKLKVEQTRLNMDKTKVEINKLTNNSGQKSVPIVIKDDVSE